MLTSPNSIQSADSVSRSIHLPPKMLSTGMCYNGQKHTGVCTTGSSKFCSTRSVVACCCHGVALHLLTSPWKHKNDDWHGALSEVGQERQVKPDLFAQPRRLVKRLGGIFRGGRQQQTSETHHGPGSERRERKTPSSRVDPLYLKCSCVK